jgi:hypothetical protein
MHDPLAPDELHNPMRPLAIAPPEPDGGATMVALVLLSMAFVMGVLVGGAVAGMWLSR